MPDWPGHAAKLTGKLMFASPQHLSVFVKPSDNCASVGPPQMGRKVGVNRFNRRTLGQRLPDGSNIKDAPPLLHRGSKLEHSIVKTFAVCHSQERE
eukprot:2083578-Amphidinium_carterae.1